MTCPEDTFEELRDQCDADRLRAIQLESYLHRCLVYFRENPGDPDGQEKDLADLLQDVLADVYEETEEQEADDLGDVFEPLQGELDLEPGSDYVEQPVSNNSILRIEEQLGPDNSITWVAVGASGTMLKPTDGAIWTARTSNDAGADGDAFSPPRPLTPRLTKAPPLSPPMYCEPLIDVTVGEEETEVAFPSCEVVTDMDPSHSTRIESLEECVLELETFKIWVQEALLKSYQDRVDLNVERERDNSATGCVLHEPPWDQSWYFGEDSDTLYPTAGFDDRLSFVEGD